MDLLQDKTTQELTDSLIAELAKTKNELRCANNDIKKATGRLNFLVVLSNELKDRSHNR